jgi:hypothetical protein
MSCARAHVSVCFVLARLKNALLCYVGGAENLNGAFLSTRGLSLFLKIT